MLSIPGKPGSTCDGFSRREFLRVGGAGIFGFSLGDILRLQAQSASAATERKSVPGWGKAKSVIMIFLQGGPSHLDIWDPKPDAPSDIRGEFQAIRTRVPGIMLSETMPLLARQIDKATLIRSVSYTPAGLFNHTAAIYQMLTGYTPDKVSPSGQLEPPSPYDYPHFGSNMVRLRPNDTPMLPFVMLPSPLKESDVTGKGGTGGFLGPAFDPYYFFQDPNQKVNLNDLALRKDVPSTRLERRARLLEKVHAAMPKMEKAVENHALDEYYKQAFGLILSGRARNAFDLAHEKDALRDRYGRHAFGQGLLMVRRLIEAGTRVVQINWPAVANGNPMVDAWDTHAANFGPLRDLHCPKLDSGLSALLDDLDQRGLLDETLVLAIGEFGRSPRLGVSTSGNGNAPDGRDHWPYCYTALMAGAGIRRGALYGKSDATGSSPVEDPVHPTEILATLYHSLGIDPKTIIYNHLKQPRELVKANAIPALFG